MKLPEEWRRRGNDEERKRPAKINFVEKGNPDNFPIPEFVFPTFPGYHIHIFTDLDGTANIWSNIKNDDLIEHLLVESAAVYVRVRNGEEAEE